MKTKFAIPGLLAVTAVGLLGAICAGADEVFQGAVADKPHYGAIFQIDSGDEAGIQKTLNNIENLLHDPRVAGKISVELIANSKGFNTYVQGNGFEQKLRHLQEEGVILAQCSNTLRELNVDRKDLYPFITVVPSGVGEITIRESQGWAYIHPSSPPSNPL